MPLLVQLELIHAGLPLGCETILGSLTSLRCLVIRRPVIERMHFRFLWQLKQVERVELAKFYYGTVLDVEDFVDLPRLAELSLDQTWPRNRLRHKWKWMPKSLKSVCVTLLFPCGFDYEGTDLVHWVRHLEAFAMGPHRKLLSPWDDMKTNDSLAAFFVPSQLPMLLHLNLQDAFFDDISAISVCTQLLTLMINLHRHSDPIGRAVVLRSLVKLHTLGCRHLYMADFLGTLPLVKSLQFWMRPVIWTPKTHAYVAQYGKVTERPWKIPPTPEVLAFLRLCSLSIRLSDWDRGNERVTPAWFTFVVTECTKLTFLEFAVCGYLETSHCIHPGDSADMSALVRLEKLVSVQMVFATSMKTLLPLKRLRVLELLRWPEGWDLAPLYVVGLPQLHRLVLDSCVDCVPLKTYPRVTETLPMLVELLHPKRNCRWQLNERCNPWRQHRYLCNPLQP